MLQSVGTLLGEKPVCYRVLRPDGRVEDVGDFSDFYVQPESDMRATEKKSLQELQDEVCSLHTQNIVSVT